jgi:aromatic ring-opening dioxygenase catalytic subunit (LigB family)
MSSHRQPSIFLPHGGGPCFFMDPPANNPTVWVAMRNYLAALPSFMAGRPAALVVISGHWETPRPTVLAAPRPGLLFDYYGFPPATYRLTFPAPGSPAVAARVRELLARAGIDSDEELARGYDHGVFIPLKVSYPDADIPIVQLSLESSLDPARHIDIGRALAPLRDENIAIIGSGLSYHNLGALRDSSRNQPMNIAAAAFDRWLTHTLCEAPVAQREEALAHWSSAPYARLCHPREEHLLPLMVAAGAAAGDPGRHAFTDAIWGKTVSAFHFG